MTELDRLLQRVALEPAYSPAFFRALLTEPVFALIPAGNEVVTKEYVRLIMWTGEDGVEAIPFFSNEEITHRAMKLNPNTYGIRLVGRKFLEASRGTTVVLNPLEPPFCRLSPSQVALLLDTGAPSAARAVRTAQGMRIGLSAPEASAEVLNSLLLILAQFPKVERGYLDTLHTNDSDAVAGWLLAVVCGDDATASQLAQQLSSMLIVAPVPQNLDLMCMRPGDKHAEDFATHSKPFYDRELGARVL